MATPNPGTTSGGNKAVTSGSSSTRPISSHSSSSSGSMKSPIVPERLHPVSSMSLPKGSSRREPPPVPPVLEGDSETRDDMLRKELEEARARAAQMEKTMRWWSDCTANWREKWSKARNERNKSREECRHLRSKLETLAKETSNHRKDKGELLAEVDTLKKKLEVSQNTEQASSCNTGSHRINSSDDVNKQDNAVASKKENADDFVSELLLRKDSKDQESCSSRDSELSHEKRKDSERIVEDPLLEQKLLAVKLKLEEAQKTIQVERDEKLSIMQQIESMQLEMSAMKVQQAELKQARDDVQSKFETLQHDHKHEIGRVTEELEDEFISRSDMDLQLAELRKELEKLQAENALEWGKRERLETEKLALERENKKLRVEIGNLEEDLERKSQQASVLLDGDLKSLQFELAEKNKELADHKHTSAKLKKAFTDKCAELEHAKSRAEQYEIEVKKLRTRVEELKQDVATGEDEVDQQANQIRRLQRTNDELQVQCENLQVQVEHLQTRLRSTSTSVLGPRVSGSRKAIDLDELVDIPTTDDDNED